MRTRTSRIAALLLLLMPVVPTLQPQTDALATFRGEVLDSEGAVIADAHVIVHMDRLGRTAQNTLNDILPTVDKLGRFSLQLSAGFFDVCVMDDAFSPVCQKILIRPGETISRKIRLKVDPEVAKQIGDRVF